MKIKKYYAQTETEAMHKVKEDLGKDALIVSMRKTSPKGFLKFFRRPNVEITAAVDQNASDKEAEINKSKEEFRQIQEIPQNQENTYSQFNRLQAKIDNLETVVNTTMDSNTREDLPRYKRVYYPTPEQNQKTNIYMDLIYHHLHENDVAEEVIKNLFQNISENSPLDEMIGSLYKKIIHTLGFPYEMELAENQQKIVFFIGPTGVGKTTTIAKIAADYALNKKKKIGLITADTYRIAAVDQLKTYAKILGIPVEVIYNPDELKKAAAHLEEKDLIFVDTAGRSHKNVDQYIELKELLNQVPEKEVFLVLSLTMKYNDIMRIIETYSSITDYKIIFTKMDETSSYGSILNIKHYTGIPLSYITFGQNVPDDIEKLSPQKAAKMLLGGYGR